MGLPDNLNQQDTSIEAISFKSYTDHLYEPVLVVDLEKKIQYYNNALITFARSNPRKMSPLVHLNELLTCSFLSDENFNQCIDNQINIISNETPLKFENIEYEVVIRLVPIVAEGKTQEVLIVIHDFSLERRLHRKYREQLDKVKDAALQMSHSDRLVLLGKISAEIAHELGGPISLIMGYGDMLKEELNSEPIQKKDMGQAIDCIIESCNRAASILEEMRNYSYLEDDKKELENLELIVNKSIVFMQPTAKSKSITIECQIAEEEFPVICHKTKLEQVLLNLIDNSIDAIVEAQLEPGTGLINITLGISTKGDQAVINIKDNGIGVGKTNQENVFEPFFTTKEMGEGTGLGLAICDNIIKWHKGNIKLVPHDVGCEFEIKLPLTEPYY